MIGTTINETARMSDNDSGEDFEAAIYNESESHVNWLARPSRSRRVHVQFEQTSPNQRRRKVCHGVKSPRSIDDSDDSITEQSQIDDNMEQQKKVQEQHEELL